MNTRYLGTKRGDLIACLLRRGSGAKTLSLSNIGTRSETVEALVPEPRTGECLGGHTLKALQFIRQQHRSAPDIGTSVRIFLGVGKTAGRNHHCVVRGDKDIARPGVILGYAINYGDMGETWPANQQRIQVSVRVKLKSATMPFFPRIVVADISCLECIASCRKKEGQ